MLFRQVANGSLQTTNVMVERAKSRVAVVTQDASNGYAVIRMPASFAARACRSANQTRLTLLLKHLVPLLKRDAVGSHQDLATQNVAIGFAPYLAFGGQLFLVGQAIFAMMRLAPLAFLGVALGVVLAGQRFLFDGAA